MQIQSQPHKIYLDTSSLSRPSDDQMQERIRREAESVQTIVDDAFRGQFHWISSEAVEMEVANTPNSKKREAIEDRLRFAHQTVLVGTAEQSRAKELEAFGFRALDALHIACAESAGAAVLLTTDDGMLKLAKRQDEELHVRIENPETWLQEITTEN